MDNIKLQLLLEKYYNEKNIIKKYILKHKIYKNYGTNKKCPKCNHKLLISDLKEYQYLCLNCDENFYDFEIK